jgi:hypothetical protein
MATIHLQSHSNLYYIKNLMWAPGATTASPSALTLWPLGPPHVPQLVLPPHGPCLGAVPCGPHAQRPRSATALWNPNARAASYYTCSAPDPVRAATAPHKK